MTEWASTDRVPGVVILAGGQNLEGDLHLQVSTATHPHGETPLEMLNRGDPFFPITISDADVRLISKDQVAAVSFGGNAPEPVPLPTTEPIGIEVEMADDTEYRGQVHIELRPPSTRGLDLMNQPERFFALSVPGRTWYLNRSHVRYVRPHD